MIRLEEMMQIAKIPTLEKKIESTYDGITLNPIKNYHGNWADAINKTISDSNEGDRILIPPVEIDKTILLKGSRTYIGQGWGKGLRAKNNANLNEMLKTIDKQSYNIIIKDLFLDGNKSNNGADNGLYLNNVTFGVFDKVKVADTKGTGFFMDKTGDGDSSTNHFLNCRTLACGRYAMYIKGEDNHIRGGDFGSSGSDAIQMLSPSSSISFSTIWGSKGNGVYIGKDVPAVQIWCSQIEGHAQNGIYCASSFCYFNGNKIYDNANVPSNYNKFDGIFIDNNATVEGCSIIGNKIYSGLYEETGIHRYGIALGNHKNFYIRDNNMYYQGNGKISKKNAIHGINNTDDFDGNTNTYVVAHLSSKQTIEARNWVKLKITKASTDIENELESSTNSIKVKESGYYVVNLNLLFDGASSGVGITANVKVNGSEKTRMGAAGINIDDNTLLNSSTVMYLNANDAVTFEVFATKRVGLLYEEVFSRVILKRLK